MNTDELKALETEVRKARFELSQKASELHDLIEDRMPAEYKEVPLYAEALYKAGERWDELSRKFAEKKKEA